MSYPNAFTAAVDGVTIVAAALINQLETKVGVNNSTDPNSLEYKINHFLAGFIGVILPFGGASAPVGFLLCDGSAVSRTTYAALFGIVGTTFGVGNGSTTFNLPDLRNRSPVGKAVSGGRATLGAVGGDLAHVHSLSISGGSVAIPVYQVASGQEPGAAPGTYNVSGASGSASEESNVDPYQVVNYIIKY